MDAPNYTTRTTCRVCDVRTTNLLPLFSLGEQYVSDFVSRENVAKGIKCPIDLELCLNCGLVQAKHTARQDFLYTRHYWYRSGVTETMRKALADVTKAAQQIVPLSQGDVVLDIGSNDGTLLRTYPDSLGVERVGVEPATNMKFEGSQGIELFINDFWSAEAFTGSKILRAKIITACGMFYDLEDPNRFIGDIAKVLHPDGVFVAQLMTLKNMLDMRDIGNLAHEHLEFYTIKCLQHLYSKHGLEIFHIEQVMVNGLSYRIYASHPERFQETAVMRYHVEQENKAELESPRTYIKFYELARKNRDHCVEFIKNVKAQGKNVWIYGASTKGNVILQWYGLDSGIIQGAADRSPEKWGKYTIGTGIPIFSEEVMREKNPDYLLVLPYTFLTEFIHRETEWRKKKGRRFIVPLPDFKIV